MGASLLPIAAISVLDSSRGGPWPLRRTVCMRNEHGGVLNGLVCVVPLPSLLLVHQLRWGYSD